MPSFGRARGRWFPFVLTLFAVFAHVRSAHARDLVRLVYEAGPGAPCGDEDLLRRGVTERLASDPFSRSAAAVVIVRIAGSTATGREDEFDGTVMLVKAGRPPTDERHLRGRCDQLMATLALTVSLAIDPDSAWRPPPPPAPEVDHDSAERRSVAAPIPGAPAEEPRRPWAFSAGGGATFSAGDAPAPVPGGLLYIAAHRDLIGGMLDVRATLPGSTSTALGRGSSWSLSFEAAPCLHVWLLFGCGVGQVGIVTASGEAATAARTQAFIASLGGRIGLLVPIGARFELRVHGDATASLMRHRLSVAGLDVYEYAPGSVGIGTLLGVRF